MKTVDEIVNEIKAREPIDTKGCMVDESWEEYMRGNLLTREEVVEMLKGIQTAIKENSPEYIKARECKAYAKAQADDCHIIQERIDDIEGRHWVASAKGYVCPVCGFEVRPNPIIYDYKCPKCGFVDINDLIKINVPKEK